MMQAAGCSLSRLSSMLLRLFDFQPLTLAITYVTLNTKKVLKVISYSLIKIRCQSEKMRFLFSRFGRFLIFKCSDVKTSAASLKSITLPFQPKLNSDPNVISFYFWEYFWRRLGNTRYLSSKAIPLGYLTALLPRLNCAVECADWG